MWAKEEEAREVGTLVGDGRVEVEGKEGDVHEGMIWMPGHTMLRTLLWAVGAVERWVWGGLRCDFLEVEVLGGLGQRKTMEI